jgi:catechol 2,3-dioxygenase-like lactoylglutathione lyase family enzyme
MADGDVLRVGKVEVGIVVKDLDATTAFPRDVLGLEYIGELDLPGGTMKRFAHGDAVVKSSSSSSPRNWRTHPVDRPEVLLGCVT